MAKDQMDTLIQQLRRVVLAGGEVNLTDRQLLEEYIGRRDEAALAVLVRRHGPLVWGVCRCVLCKHHDAEDAFQATFLVLVRKAASIRTNVANWLYGVAHRTALKARATAAKRQVRERQVTEMPEPAAIPEPELWANLEPLLDQELSRLPDKYRVAIVLCDLEGKPRQEVARQLKIPEGTLSSRLTTARKMLAKRLARHGMAVSGGALAAVLSQKGASAGVPTSVVASTIKAVTHVAAGQAAATGAVSVKVAALTEGVLKTMLLTKLKITAAVLFVVVALCSAGGLIYRTQAAEPPKAQAVTGQANQGGQPAAPRNEAKKLAPPMPSDKAPQVPKLWTLEGELKVHPLFIYRYYLELLDGQKIALYGSDHGREPDLLARLKRPVRIRVRGVLGTEYHARGTKENPSQFPAGWIVYMKVHEVKVLNYLPPPSAAPNAAPDRGGR